MPVIRIPARSSRVPSKGGKSSKGGKRPAKGPLPPPPRRESVSSSASSSSLSSPANLSNDDGYSGVEDVGDSDDDDADHVLAAEQEHIANERSSPRPTPDFNFDMDADDDDDADDADDDDSDDDSSPTPKNVQKPHSGGLEFTPDNSSSEVESWNGFNDEQEAPSLAQDIMDDNEAHTPVDRHVHFQLPCSETESDDEGENLDRFFPDIFVPEEALDSGFRLELGLREDEYSSDSQTYWDHHGDEEFEGFSGDEAKTFHVSGTQEEWPGLYGQPLGFPGDLDMDSDIMGAAMNTVEGLAFSNPIWDSGRSNTSSMVPDVSLEAEESDDSDTGYDSDGETTEEEEPVLIPKDSPIRRSMSRGSSDGEGASGSLFASRVASSTKRVCILNPITKKLMVITPQRTKRPQPTPDMTPGPFQPDFLSLQTLSFIPDDLMGAGNMSLNPFQELPAWLAPLNAQNPFHPMYLGPAMTPALFPYMGSQSSSTRTDDEEDEEDEGEKDLDVDHFLDFSEDSEEEAANDDAEEGKTTADDQNGTAKDGSGAGGDKPAPTLDILSHLGGMNVGAFRRHQTTQQLIARGEATQDSLSFANPLFNGTLRGIRDGALPAAATSLTPERRRKPQSTKSPLERESLKRRASATTDGAHKKHKSISDVRNMRI